MGITAAIPEDRGGHTPRIVSLIPWDRSSDTHAPSRRSLGTGPLTLWDRREHPIGSELRYPCSIAGIPRFRALFLRVRAPIPRVGAPAHFDDPSQVAGITGDAGKSWRGQASFPFHCSDPRPFFDSLPSLVVAATSSGWTGLMAAMW